MTPHANTVSSDHRPMRILQVVESSGGGTGRHVLDLCAGLLQRGDEVHLAYATSRSDQNFRDRLAMLPGVKQYVIPIRSSMHLSDISVSRVLRRYVQDRGPFEVVHGHSSKGGAIARLACIGLGVDLFYTMHGLVVMDRGLPLWKRGLYLAAETALKMGTTRIIAVGPEEARQAIRMGLGSRRVVTIPNGVDVEPCNRRDAVRQELGLTADSVAVGFVGRLVEQKAVDVLIKAFALAHAGAPRSRLIVIGDGPLGLELRRLAGRIGLSGCIQWLGERDAKQYYPAMDVFAISSRKEGLPYVVLEAMAAGLPVIATASSGVESLVIENENGTIVAPGDHAGFGVALRRLVCSESYRVSMGRGSLERVKQFSVQLMVKRTADLYVSSRRHGLFEQLVTHAGPRPESKYG